MRDGLCWEWPYQKKGCCIFQNACAKPGKLAVMYMCFRGIDFASFLEISIGIWNCFDNVGFFVFYFYYSDVTEKIFKIGSMEPGAMLYEANREFMVSYCQISIFCKFIFNHWILMFIPHLWYNEQRAHLECCRLCVWAQVGASQRLIKFVFVASSLSTQWVSSVKIQLSVLV